MMNNINKSSKIRQSSIAIKPEKIAAYLFRIAVCLFIFNLAGIFFQRILGYTNFFTNGFEYLFDASEENNIPTYFSTMILFIASAILFHLYLVPDPQTLKNKRYWLFLSFIFLFLSVDENISIHEQFNKIKSLLAPDTSGYLNYPWILPYGIFVLVVGGIFLKFLFSLPVKTRNLFIISGSIYVVATIGFELPEGKIVAVYGATTYYYLFCALEEFLEMSGIILFIYASLDYISFFKSSLKIIQSEKKVVVHQSENKTIAVKHEPFIVEQPNP